MKQIASFHLKPQKVGTEGLQISTKQRQTAQKGEARVEHSKKNLEKDVT